MKRALDLASLGRGKTSPNPMVGAVVVKSGRIVGEGHHRQAGGDHAEIVALKKAGAQSRGGTLYVTLEPCCHIGRTGPCCDAIVEAGIKRVVYAVKDPDTRVNGKGARRLSKAGIQVIGGVLTESAERLNEYYLSSVRLGRPFVILKLAQSLDGRIATKSGDSHWISGEESRSTVHVLRSEVDAVMIGAETARADNPKLTVRMVRGRNPYRIIVAGKRKLPQTLKLLSQDGDRKTILVQKGKTSSITLTSGAPIIWSVPADRSGQADLRAILDQAQRAGIRSIMVEGGAALATSFLRAKLVDKMIVFTAPMVIGDGISAINQLEIGRVKNAITFHKYSISASGRDWVFVGYPKWK
ncbi:MAG: bifunctional diaminohydroxyphosphoribosylaminopyrimidine deaminase/5-amino-6-(5-phosphoribosylamino)uracil reductase RibD [candidate division Zixibacteria bacterium]|nr:bifunctional diaminohydroxyphosphoribosylaminopyrimidine deaminase/5-amino-6-(5-phosphoribosylamino)uracil reductase RibD [candidate division Zixibacteria bacterium]